MKTQGFSALGGRVVAAGAALALTAVVAVGVNHVVDLRSRSAANHDRAAIVDAAEQLDEVANQLLELVEKIEITPEPEPGDLEEGVGDLRDDLDSAREDLAEATALDRSARQERYGLLGEIEDLAEAVEAGEPVRFAAADLAAELHASAGDLISVTDAPMTTAMSATRTAAVELHAALTAARGVNLEPAGWPVALDVAAIREVEGRAATFAGRYEGLLPYLLSSAADDDDFTWEPELALFVDVAGSSLADDRIAWIDETGDVLADLAQLIEELDDGAGDATSALADDQGRQARNAVVVLVIAAALLLAAAIWAVREIRRRHRAEQSLRHLAIHDQLTGLLNRSQLEHRFADLARPAALLYIDIDDFKVINDSYGHHAGDELLVALTRRLKMLNADERSLFRLGGDELLIMVPECPADQAMALADGVLAELSVEVLIDGAAISSSASIGVAVVPDGTTPLGAALKEADAALYVAKTQGRGRAVLGTADAVVPHRLPASVSVP